MEAAISRHTFGVEFEIVFAPGYTLSGAAQVLSEVTGLSVIVGDRRALTRRDSHDWRVVTDGSVRGEGTPGELVSPVLKGQAGLDEVTKIANALVRIGATVNPSCGFHVHVGGIGADLQFFKNLVKLYAKFEPVIDQLMPPSRRGGTNVYCRSLSGIDQARIDAAPSLNALIEAQTGLRHRDYSSRFFKLNLAAFLKHTTVEFRQHAGTTDAQKATAWIKTCLRMVAAAKAGKTGAPRPAPRNFDHLPAKARKVAEMVSQPNGATRREIMAGTDWPVLSVNRQARVAGIQVMAVRTGGEERFYAVTSAQSEIAADLAGFVSILEASEDEAAFLLQRRAELAR